MRTRLVAAVAVFAAAFVAPTVVLAAPVLVTPTSPVVTKDATPPIDFTWTDDGANAQFQVVSGDPSGGACPSPPANKQLVSGTILSTDTFEYPFTPSANGTSCYYVEGFDGVTFTESAPVRITYDTLPPTGAITSPAIVHTTVVALTASASDAGSGVDTVAFERSSDGGANWFPISTDSDGAPYTADWDTSDGVYLVHAVITDNLGNASFTTPDVSLRIDRIYPTVAVTAPAASTTVHGTNVTVSASASDAGAGIASVAFFADGGGGPILLGTVSGAGPYSVSWDTTTVASPDGLYSIWAVATDGATLQTTSSSITNVRVDNTSPSGSITAPTAGALLHGTTGLTASAADVGGVASVKFEQSSDGGAHWSPISTDSTGPSWTANWNTTGLDGAFSVHAVITDAVGNTPFTTPSVAVTLDNTAPTVVLGGLANNAKVSGSVPLSATAADTGSGMASVQFGWQAYPAGGGYTNIGSAVTAEPYTKPFDTTAVSDGVYEIRALATDVATNTQGNSVIAVLIDNQPPNAPAAPTGLSPVSASPTISFNASTGDVPTNGVQSGLDHYDVYRDGVKVNAAPIPVGIGGPYTWSDVAGQSLSLPSGNPPHAYSYRVKAVDAAGNSSVASAFHVIVLDSVAGTAPTSVTALASPTSQVPQVSWGPPANFPVGLVGVDHYNVYRNSGGSPVGVVQAPATTFTDVKSSLDAAGGDGSYTYQVVAAASDGTTVGVASAAVTVVYDTTAPAAPAGVVASPALDGSISISWTAASDGSGSGIARYVVRRSLSSVPPASVSDGDATCQVAALSCSDATALNGKLYSYAVFAVDRAGNASLAGIAPGVTARDQLAPAKPSGLTATPGDASVALKWAAAGPDDDVAGYVLVAKQGTQPPGNESDGTRVCPAIVVTSTTCVATGLTNGATYTFGLFALDEALNRSLPAVVSTVPNGKVTDVKAPAAVSNLKAKVSGHKVTLTWKNPADHDFDHVEITAGTRKPAALKASKRVYSGKGTKATTTLGAGQSRWFVVVAYDAVGNASAPASVHVTIPAPSKFGPAPRAKVHGRVRLSWPVAKGAKYYNVQVYVGKKRILVSWPARRALQLPRAKLKRGTTYTWYVWPGLGAKAKAHYGKLIGKNAFTFTG
ncbi:MAG: Ig-like domain-containing protein [Actinomycetota bacterium]|nr:Ig-like domain-containing protein [Actinomycetota bacterium]